MHRRAGMSATAPTYLVTPMGRSRTLVADVPVSYCDNHPEERVPATHWVSEYVVDPTLLLGYRLGVPSALCTPCAKVAGTP